MKELDGIFYCLSFAILLASCSSGSDSASEYGDNLFKNVGFDDSVASKKTDIVDPPRKMRAGTSESRPRNLIKNGNFEEKARSGLPSGWGIVPDYKGKGTAVLDERYTHSGKYSLKLRPNRKNTSAAFGVFTMLNRDELKGKEVTISGFVKVKGIGNNSTVLLLKTDKENWITLPQDTKRTFVPFSKALSIAESIPEAGLLLLVSGTRGTVWFDDLSLHVTSDSLTHRGRRATLIPSDNEYVNKINTPGWQDSVYISPDGKEIYFAYMPYVQKDFLDLYFGRISEKDVKQRGPIRPDCHGTMNFETYKAVRNEDGTWGRVINLNINSTYSLYSAKLSHDGKELYYAIRDYEGNYGGDDIYVSKKLSDGSWSKPQNLGPNINTKAREDTPCLSSDGKTLYFGRNKHEMLGWEIMVSHRVEGKWTKANSLREPINQPRPETTANYQPFVTADGKEFYFTRIQQLYVSKKQPNGNWGKPVKVFPKLAVSGHASVTDDNRYLYFLTAKDKESLKRQHWTIWYSERQENGTWGDPKPVD